MAHILAKCTIVVLAVIVFVGSVSASVELELYWDTGDIGVVQDIEVADVDMDGMKETIVALELGYGVTSPVVIYDGVSQAIEHTIWLPLGNANQLEVTDIDGDGVTELIVGSTTNWEQGAQGYIYIYNGTTYDLKWESENIGTVASLHVQDFDLDGVKEIFAGIAYVPVQQDFGMILVLDGITHTIEFNYFLATDFLFQQRSTVCNLDGDPSLEIIFAAIDYSVPDSSEIFVMDGMTHAIDQQWSGSGRCYGITSGDVDNDGEREIIISLTTGNTVADLKQVKLFNTSWAEECSYVFSPHVGWGPAPLALGDVDGDIIPEIVVGTHLGTGVGNFSILDGQICSLIWSDGAGGSVEVVVFGDVNNDGRTELCVGDRAGWSSGRMRVYNVLTGATVCNAFLTPDKLNVMRDPEHSFKVHVYPCEPIDVSVGDTAEVYVDLDDNGNFDEYESFLAIVSSTDSDGNATDIAVKVYDVPLTEEIDPYVAIYNINNIPIVDTLGNPMDYLQLITFSPHKSATQPAIPDQVTLQQNHPNPFNPETIIKYSLPQSSYVRLTIYNILGQRVITLVDEYQRPGAKEVFWDGKDEDSKQVANGIYFYRIQTRDFVQSKKMLLVK